MVISTSPWTSILEFSNLGKMKITSSKPKYYLVRSGKKLITSLGLKAIKMLKRKILPLLKAFLGIFIRLLRNSRMCLMRVMRGRGPNACLLAVISI